MKRATPLPAHLVTRLNDRLGSAGRPYFSGTDAAPSTTNGLIWTDLTGTADEALSAARAVLAGEAAVAYKRIHVWLGPHAAQARGVVVIPAADQFDSVRTEMGAAGYPEAEAVVRELQGYDLDFGLTVDGADYATVEFTLHRLPAGAEVEALNARLKAFSPDILYCVGEEAFDFAAYAGRVVLWWD